MNRRVAAALALTFAASPSLAVDTPKPQSQADFAKAHSGEDAKAAAPQTFTADDMQVMYKLGLTDGAANQAKQDAQSNAKAVLDKLQSALAKVPSTKP